eukprot:CAMPEP_0198114854 /NCGR_PEP_ID=MMETSP1442-20131203/6110_1 /TAXON_ID= /ORGANISM="Craspedostauros australis, Strain CCMP3328" /LENGTH=52 /DNA_ID=CAMNT_0043772253 /DNA_START=864 /DNA_END=1022 /DNA_ORIENTATION=-
MTSTTNLCPVAAMGSVGSSVGVPVSLYGATPFAAVHTAAAALHHCLTVNGVV